MSSVRKAGPALAVEDEQPVIVDDVDIGGTNLTLPAIECAGDESLRLRRCARVVVELSGLLVIARQHEMRAIRRHPYGAETAFDGLRRERRDRDDPLAEERHVGDEWIRDAVQQKPRRSDDERRERDDSHTKTGASRCARAGLRDVEHGDGGERGREPGAVAHGRMEAEQVVRICRREHQTDEDWYEQCESLDPHPVNRVRWFLL